MTNRDKELYIRVSEEELHQMKELAEYLDLPLATLARNMLLAAKEDAEFLKQIGVLKGAKKYHDFIKKWEQMSSNFEQDKAQSC